MSDDLTQDAAVVGDDVHQTVADVRALVSQALAPVKALAEAPWRLIGTTDLKVAVSAFEAAAHVLVNHIEGIEQSIAPPPSQEVAADPVAEAGVATAEPIADDEPAPILAGDGAGLG